MTKFRKKPVTIDAYLWKGGYDAGAAEFLGSDFLSWGLDFNPLYIRTLEGRIEASPGDYLIRGVEGEHYPCKPEIFHKTYDPVYDSSAPCSRCGWHDSDGGCNCG